MTWGDPLTGSVAIDRTATVAPRANELAARQASHGKDRPRTASEIVEMRIDARAAECDRTPARQTIGRQVEIVRTRRRLLFLTAGLLGALVVILPAVAGSETSPTITAENFGGGIYGEQHRWSPSQAAIAPGGTVTLRNPTEVKHGIEWISPPATPTCDSGVPVGTSEAASNTKWSGTCTFTTPGEYVFYCTVHHAAMSGRVTVAQNGTTTITPPSSSPGAGSTGNEPGPANTLAAGAPGSPLAGSAASAVKLASSQHGRSVRGSVGVSPAGAGGRLEVDLLAKSGSLASAAQPARVRVGRLVRAPLSAGTMSFAVPLSSKAKSAIKRKGRLALTVKVVLRTAAGPAVTVARGVILHR